MDKVQNSLHPRVVQVKPVSRHDPQPPMPTHIFFLLPDSKKVILAEFALIVEVGCWWRNIKLQEYRKKRQAWLFAIEDGCRGFQVLLYLLYCGSCSFNISGYTRPLWAQLQFSYDFHMIFASIWYLFNSTLICQVFNRVGHLLITDISYWCICRPIRNK